MGHFLVFAMCASISLVPGIAKADLDLSKPTRDVLDLCTWATSDRASVARQFYERGWTKFRAPYPKLTPKLVADGYLFHALVDEGYNSLGLDTNAGVIPPMQEHMETISQVSERGVYDALLWKREPLAFLMLYDQPGATSPKKTLGCRYFGASHGDATQLKDAIWDFDEETYESEYGPARVVTEYTSGHPPHRPLAGAAGLLVKFGILEDRPVLEPQLGAGRASIQFFRFDESQFVDGFGREPNTAFALEIHRGLELSEP